LQTQGSGSEDVIEAESYDGSEENGASQTKLACYT